MNTGLKRSGTLQATLPPHSQNSTPPDTSEQPEEDEYVFEAEDTSVYEDEYYQPQQHQQFSNSSIGRSSPWSPGNEWKQAYTSGNSGGNAAIDDVQRALSALELASNQSAVPNMQQGGYGGYQHTGQSNHPPRFNPQQGTQPQHQSAGLRGNNGNGGNSGYNQGNNNSAGNGHRAQTGNDFDGRKTPVSQSQRYTQQQNYGQQRDERDQGLRGRASNPNLQYGYQQSGGGHIKSGSASSSNAGSQPGPVPSVPPIPPQYLQQQTGQGNQGGRPGLGVATTFTTSNAPVPSGQTPVQPFANTPIDVPSLIAMKGYNPATFDTRPQFARYFVIKSYTEDDVHKSLKYEIWSSTDPGNKRLDKAFKDTAGRGPIYLFFSVNASGHFCGMAEMLTPVRSFLFRQMKFVHLPLISGRLHAKQYSMGFGQMEGGLQSSMDFCPRHPQPQSAPYQTQVILLFFVFFFIILNFCFSNTQERKPVTNSRDTQELLPDAGQEMLRIFHTHPARTSLLQDFAFYEV